MCCETIVMVAGPRRIVSLPSSIWIETDSPAGARRQRLAVVQGIAYLDSRGGPRSAGDLASRRRSRRLRNSASQASDGRQRVITVCSGAAGEAAADGRRDSCCVRHHDDEDEACGRSGRDAWRGGEG